MGELVSTVTLITWTNRPVGLLPQQALLTSIYSRFDTCAGPVKLTEYRAVKSTDGFDTVTPFSWILGMELSADINREIASSEALPPLGTLKMIW